MPDWITYFGVVWIICTLSNIKDKYMGDKMIPNSVRLYGRNIIGKIGYLSGKLLNQIEKLDYKGASLGDNAVNRR
ncbi:MAG: hypothetical protein ACE5KE_06565 [Methanosarcinales archaeon]